MAVINGTPGDDFIVDTDGDDIINGGDGNDRLFNGRGNDIIYGGAGNDRITRLNQDGVDQLFGEDGDDFIDSNVTGGNQSVDGGSGNDLLYLGFFAASGNGNVFTARGGSGQDSVILGQGGSGTLNLGTGRYSNLVLNSIDLGTENDFLTLTGRSFSRVTLGSGSDTILIGYDIGTVKGEWPDYVSFTDYTPGTDRISALHFNSNSLVGWNGTTNPFSAGLLRLVQDGADAVLQRNLGTSFHDFIRFENVQTGTLTAADFGGYDPSGAKPAGLVVTGTEGNDERVLSGDSRIVGGLVGSVGDDTINGLGGNDFIIAYGGDDTIDGGIGNDSMFGGAGNDTIRGGAGSDDIRGDEGLDTALYAGAYRGYTRALVGGAGTVAGGREGGTDQLASIENVRFADGVLTFDPDSRAAQIARMYDTVLQRSPDVPGLEFYLDEMERGVSLLSIAQAFLGSAEFQAATGALSNAQYVEYLYNTALGRGSDAAGKAYWVGQLDSGAQTRADLLVGFSESAEHRQLTADLVAQGFFETDDAYQAVALLYDSFNQRRPDEEGLVFYGEAIKNGTFTLAQIADQFAGSAEFRAATAGMTNGQLVDFMYQNTLDRLPDAEGRAYYINQLNSGAMDLGDILLDFSQSLEHTNLLTADITGGIALAGSSSTSSTAEVESARMLMQEPDMRLAFAEAGADIALLPSGISGIDGGTAPLADTSRLDVYGF